MAARKEMPDDVVDNIMKYVPILREPEIGLHRAADYLMAWVTGSLPKAPLLRLHACLALFL